MERQPIPVDALRLRSHDLWNGRWLLLAAGDFAAGDFNAMTVSWGSLGTIWNRPFAQVVVRPTRFTYGFMERYPDFTLTAFPEALRPALQLLGSRSGRDGDKIRESGLTPIAAARAKAPAFAEAELVIECRKIYWHDIAPERFLDPAIDANYPLLDYHRAYFGEILAVSGAAAYRG